MNLSPDTREQPADCPEVSPETNAAICRTAAVTATSRFINNASVLEPLTLAGWPVRDGGELHKQFRSHGAGC